MSINLLVVAWYSRLASKGILDGGSVLELGPQHILNTSREAVLHYAMRQVGDDIAIKLVDRIFFENEFRPEGISAFYELFGYDHYRSIDLHDNRADWTFNLNDPLSLPERFNLITNFGTAEHVFNVGNVFKVMHDALETGGLMVHILPAFGEVDHGFYNIHPTVYFDVAEANGYVIEDFQYIDSIDIRSMQILESFPNDFAFDSLPIQLAALDEPDRRWSKILAIFEETYNSKELRQKYPAAVIPKDYAFVALRKINNKKFAAPMQNIYSMNNCSPSCRSLPMRIRILNFLKWLRKEKNTKRK